MTLLPWQRPIPATPNNRQFQSHLNGQHGGNIVAPGHGTTTTSGPAYMISLAHF